MENLANVVVQNCKKHPNKICLIQKNKKVTYQELCNLIVDFKKYLQEKNIVKDQKILVLVPMSIELYVTLIALWSIGAVPCFMDAGFIKNGMKNNEFEDIAGVIGTSKYILYSNINSNLKKLKLKINVNIISKNSAQKEDRELDVVDINGDFPGILTYTSGTTGKPKTASRTHSFLMCQANILMNSLDYEEDDVEISTIPIFTLSNINAGITTVIADANFSNLGKSNPKKIADQITNNKVNRIMAAPGLLNVITTYCMKKNITLDNVNKIFTGGGAVFLDFVQKLKRVFKNSSIVTLYGSTEAEPIAELNLKDMTEQDIEKTKIGSGILAGNIIGVEDCKTIKVQKEIGKLTLEEFKELQTNEVGEIVVTGDNVLKGYVNGYGDAENKFNVDGKIYHRTGDLGIFDEQGRIWLRGRIKEPFFNIEAALHANFDDIGKTAVFKNNEKIILVLENDNISKKDIKNAITFATIDDIRYVKKIPVDKRHSTKVDYNELRKLLKLEESLVVLRKG